MTTVLIDGVPYAPAVAGGGVGVAVTTHNRPQVLADTLAAFAAMSPDIPVVVVDDGSQVPVSVPPGVELIRHDSAQGIPAAKNRCLAALMDLGVEHLFLFDDDTRPATPDWWRPYVESPEPHLQHSWTHSVTGKAVPKMGEIYRDSGLVAYSWSMGCLLYATAEVVARVGGMRWEFGPGMEEHAEWSRRVCNAGLTTFVHQDVPGSETLIWAADRHGAVPRSLPDADRSALLERNERLRLGWSGDDSFVNYRHRDVLITAWLTGHPDPQRNGAQPAPADDRPLAGLRESAQGHELVVLSDSLPGAVTVPAPLCAYTQRWIAYHRYLREHPDVRFAWLLDATDVRVLNDPFPTMTPGVLYCGWEPEVVGCAWIRAHSPNHARWVEDHAAQMLLNCGVVGGDRATLMRLCRTMIDLWADGDRSDPLEEMTLFNIAARRQPRLVTGVQVTTVFKTYATAHPTAFFAHK